MHLAYIQLQPCFSSSLSKEQLCPPKMHELEWKSSFQCWVILITANRQIPLIQWMVIIKNLLRYNLLVLITKVLNPVGWGSPGFPMEWNIPHPLHLVLSHDHPIKFLSNMLGGEWASAGPSPTLKEAEALLNIKKLKKEG